VEINLFTPYDKQVSTH